MTDHFVSAIDQAWTLVEQLRRDACLYADQMPPRLADSIEALGALLDEGGILDAAALATDPEDRPHPVLVDTAEQRPLTPWTWRKRVPGTKTRAEVPAGREDVPTSRTSIEWGDYAPAHELARPWAIVERKGLDWATTIFGSTTNALGEVAPNLTRFRRELTALGDLNRRGGRACVQLELDWSTLLKTRTSGVSPVSFESFLVDIWYDYGVPVFVLGGRERSAFWIGHGFSRLTEQATNPKAAAKARARGLELAWLAPEAP